MEKTIKEILDDTCVDILEYTKADSISILLYDIDSKIIKPYIISEDVKIYYDKITNIYINEEIEDEIIYGNLIPDKLKSIEDIRKEGVIKEKYLNMEQNMKYLGCYKISIDNKFIGILNLYYKTKPISEGMRDNFINFICKMIGTIVKNSKLSEEIKIENKKRVMVEQQLEKYLHVSKDLLTVFGIDGNIKTISSSWMELLGWDKESILKRNTIDYVHVDDLKIISDLKRRQISKGKVNINTNREVIRYLCKDGSYKWVDFNIQYIEECELFLSTGKDITQKIIAEEQKKILEEAIKIESAKSEFLANISHEFKTPLNIILGTMQIMKKNIECDNISIDSLDRYVNNIRQNSYRLLRLVNNLIDISKIDIGFYDLALSNNNIISIIEDITISVVEYVENKNIDIIFDTDSEDIIIACDPNAIERVMLNLLSNAIKYTSCEDGKIVVNIKTTEDNIEVSVKDNGAGIPNDKIDIIFDRFGQADTTLTRACEGSGIGLSLTQSIIELHGGNIRVNSIVGKGSEFIFQLPTILVENENKIYDSYSNDKNRDSYIEKCNVEFSDIYSV